MGQSLKAAINTEQKAIEQLRSAFRTARYCGYTKDQLNARLVEVFDNLPKSFAITRRTTLYAIRMILWSEMFERDLEFVYKYKGKTFSVNKNTKHHKPTKNVNARLLHEKNEGGAFWWIEKGVPYEPFSLR
jgi:hypothetical protein